MVQPSSFSRRQSPFFPSSEDSRSSPLPDSDQEEELRRAEEKRALAEDQFKQGQPSTSNAGKEKKVKAPIARRFFRTIGGSKLGRSNSVSRIGQTPTLLSIAQATCDLDMFCRNQLDAIVVNPNEKRYFIPITQQKATGNVPYQRFISVFRDEKGYFVISSYDRHVVIEHLTLAAAGEIDLCAEKYFIPGEEEGLDLGKTKYYFTQESIKFIHSTTKMYLPEGGKEIEFVAVESFTDITIRPPHPTEVMISRCFVDPKTDSGFDSGDVNPSFKLLQAETEKINEHVDPLKSGRILGDSYVNNYPMSAKRQQINCDAFWSCSFLESNYSISIVADGCGGGPDPREAAQSAVAAAKEYILAHLFEFQTLEQFTQMVLTAFEQAHLKCIENVYISKTTTLNISFAFTAASGERYLLAVGLGDTKTYLCTQTNEGSRIVVDLSQHERAGFDVTDPGGALGGFTGSRNEKYERVYITPYMKNLSVVCCKLDPTKDYFVLNVTDGVSDNFDPESCGLSPGEVNFVIDAYDPGLKWKHIKRPSLRLKLMTKYATEWLADILSEYTFSEADNLDKICQRITQHCFEMTLASREFMEKNTKTMQPVTSKEFPGKMDHTTAVAFKIFRAPSSECSSSSSSTNAYGI